MVVGTGGGLLQRCRWWKSVDAPPHEQFKALFAVPHIGLFDKGQGSHVPRLAQRALYVRTVSIWSNLVLNLIP